VQRPQSRHVRPVPPSSQSRSVFQVSPIFIFKIFNSIWLNFNSFIF
jgi:hypothetical protein